MHKAFTKMKTKLAIISLIFISGACFGQTFSEKITREIGFEKKTIDNALIVDNINGSIKVEGYDGDKIILEVEKTITAKTPERLQEGKEQVQLGVIDRADTLIFYVAGICEQFGKGNNARNRKRWGYNWDNCEGRNNACHEVFEHRMNFTIKVPYAIHVDLRTINNGDIVVDNIRGCVNANNINGNIRLSNLTKKARASTINGNVDITYDHNPDSDCRFYTLNGNINADFQKGLAANLSFESFNGSFFTNIDHLESLPPQVEERSGEPGIRYKVKIKGNQFQIGKGGARLDFETFNGNVYLREKIN